MFFLNYSNIIYVKSWKTKNIYKPSNITHDFVLNPMNVPKLHCGFAKSGSNADTIGRPFCYVQDQDDGWMMCSPSFSSFPSFLYWGLL